MPFLAPRSTRPTTPEVAAGDPEPQNFGDLHVSGRVAVSSLANFLFVFLLRLNHVLAPIIVSFFRARRDRWIARVKRDVQEELRLNPNNRQLCAGPCCQVSYGTFGGASDRSVPTVMTWVRAVSNVTTDFANSSTTDSIAAAAVFIERVFEGDAVPRTRPASETEIYFTLRVEQESRHRRKKQQRMLDPDLVLISLTLLTIIVYSTAIIWGVQYWYRLDLWELSVFSSSLLTTAFLAEGATLKRAWRMFFGEREFPPVGSAADLIGKVGGAATALMGHKGQEESQKGGGKESLPPLSPAGSPNESVDKVEGAAAAFLRNEVKDKAEV